MGLNSGQQFVYRVLSSGCNVFLTGGAGVGKTYTINYFIDKAHECGMNIMVCAPTGIAASNINGATIHRQFRAPIGIIDCRDYEYNLSEELYSTDILIIDEISMCRADLFDFVGNNIARANYVRRTSDLKLIQLVVVGDFFQLPPVLKNNEQYKLNSIYNKDMGVGFAFESHYWKEFNFQTVLLTEIVRQADSYFIEHLNNIRIGNKAYIDMIYNKSSKIRMQGAITLCGKNDEANRINNSELSKISSELKIYTGKIIQEQIYEASDEITFKDAPVDKELNLKVGARIMTLLNKDGYTNGSLGYITELYDDSITIKLDDGTIAEVHREKWDIIRYKKNEKTDKLESIKVGYIEQFPIRLAYAITIHKSQGQTYDEINLNPYCWDCGQLYVALSRVKSIESLHFLSEPDPRYVVVSLNVIKFYNNLSYAQIKDYKNTPELKSKQLHFEGELGDILSRLKAL